MDYDMISRMNVDDLKKYLRLRALKVSGIVACLFENNVLLKIMFSPSNQLQKSKKKSE